MFCDEDSEQGWQEEESDSDGFIDSREEGVGDEGFGEQGEDWVAAPS